MGFTIRAPADVRKRVGVLAHIGLYLEDIHTRGAAREEALSGLNNPLLLVLMFVLSLAQHMTNRVGPAKWYNTNGYVRPLVRVRAPQQLCDHLIYSAVAAGSYNHIGVLQNRHQRLRLALVVCADDSDVTAAQVQQRLRVFLEHLRRLSVAGRRVVEHGDLIRSRVCHQRRRALLFELLAPHVPEVVVLQLSV